MTESTKDEKDKLEESPSPSVKNGENQMETSWIRWIDAPFITIALTGVFYFGGRIYVENYYTNLGLPIDLYSDNFRILVGEGWIELILFLAFLLFILFILFTLMDLFKYKYLKNNESINKVFGLNKLERSTKYLSLLLVDIVLIMFMYGYWKYSANFGYRSAKSLISRLHNKCEGILSIVSISTKKGENIQRTGFIFSDFGKFVILMTDKENIALPIKNIKKITYLKNDPLLCNKISKGFPILK